MQSRKPLSLCILALALGACSHLTANTNQFYLAQTYLPLAKVPTTEPSPGIGPATCASGPVVNYHRADPDRALTKLLPGMTLHILQTSYSSVRDDAVPIVSDWSWTLPRPDAATGCTDRTTAVPDWTRSDLLIVRNLLSGSQHPQQMTANTQYFEEAITEECAGQTAISNCLEQKVLNKFVAGLVLNLRGQGDKPTPLPDPAPSEFDPGIPAGVQAGAHAGDIDQSVGLARWYNGLSAYRPEDLFPAAKQATECARAFADPKVGTDISTQDAEVCAFALASLEWRGDDQRLPGATLKNVAKLWLLRSGDPLLMMQPQAYRDPLDVGAAGRCAGDPACHLRNRMAQGFTQIDILVPVFVEGGQRRLVPIGMSVADFERHYSTHVRSLRRSVDWLPETILLEDTKTIPARKAASGGRVLLSFADASGKGGAGGGIVIMASGPARAPGIDATGAVKDDILFAPGDIVTLDRPR